MGALLATTPIGTIVEWFDVSDGQADAWHQAQFDNDRRVQHRSWSARFGWSGWAHVDVSCDLRYPARQVPPDRADADPSRRLRDAIPSGTPDQTVRWADSVGGVDRRRATLARLLNLCAQAVRDAEQVDSGAKEPGDEYAAIDTAINFTAAGALGAALFAGNLLPGPSQILEYRPPALSIWLQSRRDDAGSVLTRLYLPHANGGVWSEWQTVNMAPFCALPIPVDRADAAPPAFPYQQVVGTP